MTYPRIVHRNEQVSVVALEAYSNGLYVFSNPAKGKTVISKKKPGPGYLKMDARFLQRTDPKDCA